MENLKNLAKFIFLFFLHSISSEIFHRFTLKLIDHGKFKKSCKVYIFIFSPFNLFRNFISSMDNS